MARRWRPGMAVQERNRTTADETHDQKDLTQEELDQQGCDQLPEREEMSLINANVAIPGNAAVAANVLSDNSTATADATQTAPITQTKG